MANMFGSNTLPDGVDPVQQIVKTAGLPPEAVREALAAMTECYDRAKPTKRPLGRVARIFHRRGMWSLSAEMLAPSGDEP